MKVLVVDDSVVFRSQIKAALEEVEEITTVSTANNGKIALDRLKLDNYDLVTLDLEMPVLNGMETLEQIKKLEYTCKIIIFSSQTQKGSSKTLECLSLGADDFVPKPTGDQGSFEKASESIKNAMLPKVRQFLKSNEILQEPVAQRTPEKEEALVYPKVNLDIFTPDIVLIGCSTGGPPALDHIFSKIKGPLRVPILICQHMPPVFTASLAKRIGVKTGIVCKEAEHGEVLKNNIYIAPGDFHMTVEKSGEQVILKLDQSPPQNMVRPAVDPLFETAAKIWGQKAVAFVLTGMGSDGMIGCKSIKNYGGGVMIQDEESCVVYGMPKAVYDVNAFDEQKSLGEISNYILKYTKG